MSPVKELALDRFYELQDELAHAWNRRHRHLRNSSSWHDFRRYLRQLCWDARKWREASGAYPLAKANRRDKFGKVGHASHH